MRPTKYDWDEILKDYPGSSHYVKLQLLREVHGGNTHEFLGVKHSSFYRKCREEGIQRRHVQSKERTYIAQLDRLMMTPVGDRIRAYNKAVLRGENPDIKAYLGG